jgi:hypothetical protein
LLSAALGFFSGVGLHAGLERAQASPMQGQLTLPPVAARPAYPSKPQGEQEVRTIMGGITIEEGRKYENVVGRMATLPEAPKRRYELKVLRGWRRGK